MSEECCCFDSLFQATRDILPHISFACGFCKVQGRILPKLQTYRAFAHVQAAADAYGAEDKELWLRYIQFLQTRKKSTGQLHWRASKMLRDPGSFHLAYQAQQQISVDL